MGRAVSISHQTRTTKRHPASLSAQQEHRLRFNLRRIACSEAWVDAQIKSFDSPTLVFRVFNPHAFPPGGRAETKMRWCRSCGRYTPPNCIHLIEHHHGRAGGIFASTLQCDDCNISNNDERYRELYEAGLHLRPASSQSFTSKVKLRARLKP